MPSSVTVHVYLGSGQAGVDREQTIKREMKARDIATVGAFIVQAIDHFIGCKEAKKK